MPKSNKALTDLKNIKKLRVADTTQELSRIKSMNFHFNGERIVYNLEENIQIVNLGEKVNKFLFSTRKYGAGLCKFYDLTHLVHTSTKLNDNLRLLDISVLSYVTYFPGHSKEVTSFDVSEKLIVSGSKDTTVRLWDPRRQSCLETKKFKSTPLVAFHPNCEEILAVAYDSSKIELFSTKNLLNSVQLHQVEKIDDVEWTSIKFSEDGKFLMLTTNSSSIVILDAAFGQPIQNFRDYGNPEKKSIEACFVPGTNLVLGGSFEGLVQVWDLKSPFKMASLKSCHEGACNNVTFNPKFACMATTSDDTNFHLWIEKDC